jgi:hypothetical protein
VSVSVPDPGYLWRLVTGRVPADRSTCERCGRDLYNEAGWWSDEESGSIRCPDGETYHRAALGTSTKGG